MSDTPSGDIVSKNPKTTLLTTFTAILETAIQHIKNDDYRQIAVPIAPFAALILIIVLKTLYKNYKSKRTIKMHNGWITSLESELHNTNTLTGRKKEILKEIAGYQAEIKKIEKDSIGIDFS